MRNVTVVSFLATVAVVVPAGWRSLGAGIRSDGKRMRPLHQSVTIDGARVTLDVDRGVIYTGDSVVATLRAYADAPKRVAVDLYAYDSSNYEGERVETPAVAIDHEKIELAAAPGGGKPVATKIVLGTRPSSPALVDNFRIVVTARGAKLAGDDDEHGVQLAAAAGVLGWSGNSLAISIEPRGTIRDGEPFVVAVRVKNTTKRAVPRPSTYLYTQISPDGYATAEDAIEIEPRDGDDRGGELAPGAEQVSTFDVELPVTGRSRLALLAQSFSYKDLPGPAAAGAMDVKTIAVEPATAPIAVK